MVDKRGYHQLAKLVVQERLLIFRWRIEMHYTCAHTMIPSLCLRMMLQEQTKSWFCLREPLVAVSMRGLVASVSQMSGVGMVFVDFRHIDV